MPTVLMNAELVPVNFLLALVATKAQTESKVAPAAMKNFELFIIEGLIDLMPTLDKGFRLPLFLMLALISCRTVFFVGG